MPTVKLLFSLRSYPLTSDIDVRMLYEIKTPTLRSRSVPDDIIHLVLYNIVSGEWIAIQFP